MYGETGRQQVKEPRMPLHLDARTGFSSHPRALQTGGKRKEEKIYTGTSYISSLFCLVLAENVTAVAKFICERVCLRHKSNMCGPFSARLQLDDGYGFSADAKAAMTKSVRWSHCNRIT